MPSRAGDEGMNDDFDAFRGILFGILLGGILWGIVIWVWFALFA